MINNVVSGIYQWTLDTLFFIHMSLHQPWVHKGNGAAVIGTPAGVGAPHILLGQCSKISACWHHLFLQIKNFITAVT